MRLCRLGLIDCRQRRQSPIASQFFPLHGMQTRSSDENSVCLSVRPLSVKRVICDKMEERSVYIFIPYERSFSLVFWEEEWLVVATPYTWNFEPNLPRWSEIANIRSIFARSASAVTLSEKTQLTLTGSRFPMSLRWTSYVVPKLPKGAQKRRLLNLNSKLR